MSRGAKTSIILFLTVCLILFTGVFTALPVDAAEVEEGVELDEEEEDVRVVEGLRDLTSSSFNYSKHDATNKARINQFGYKNTATIEQIGENNYGGIDQYGEENISHIEQKYSNNIGQTVQIGSENDAAIYQDNSESLYEGSRFGLIIQAGNRNIAEIEQEGSINFAAIGQFGENNEADVYQDHTLLPGLPEAETIIQQNGDNNNASIIDMNEDINSIDVVQNGNNRDLEIIFGD